MHPTTTALFAETIEKTGFWLEELAQDLGDASLQRGYSAARRRLEDYERRRRGDVKRHTGKAHGGISELDSAQGFGRIETEDGRLIYFHCNSLIDGRFEDLTTGTEVRFAEEAGDLGPQASTVYVISGAMRSQ